jgi:hypothetical protein
MEGCCILYADYFLDDPLHGEVVFQRHFRMSSDGWRVVNDDYGQTVGNPKRKV